MKTCTRCQKPQDLSNFNFKNRERCTLQPHCRSCSRAYAKSHYSRNTSYYTEKARTRNRLVRQEIQQRLLSYLSTHPCVDCGESDPVVLDFDHKEIRSKLDNIGDMIKRRLSWSRIGAELEKCLVRCAKCHRRRTAEQFGWYRIWPRSSVG